MTSDQRVQRAEVLPSLVLLMYACRSATVAEVGQDLAVDEVSSVPSGARRDTFEEMRDDARSARSPGDGGGTVRKVAGPDTVVAGSELSLGVELEVGPHGIAVGGAVVLTPSPFWGWSPPQDVEPLASGFTTITPPEGAHLETTIAAGMLIATVRDLALTPGQVVRFDWSGRADRFAERAPALWFGVDADGDGVRALIPEAVVITTTAGEPAGLVATLPSAAEPGDTVTLRVAAVDSVGNAFLPLEGAVSLRAAPGLDLPASLALRAPDHGVLAVPIRALQAGVYVVAVEGPRGLQGLSNPMVVRTGATPIRWADLQIHTALSDGTGDPVDVYRYAREVAGLDAAAITDHDHWGMRFLDDTPEWRDRITAATAAAHAPGAFVTADGYEWTSWIWGHRHVVAFDGPVPIASSLDERFDTIEELRGAMSGRLALIVPHHPAGGPVPIDWASLVPDPVLEPLVEVASVHGQSDSLDLPGAIYGAVPGAFVQDQLGRGLRFGLVGSTDGHDGHPGLSHLAGGGGGLAAIEAAELTREGLYRALRARRTYATNGPRIVLRVDAGGAPMGSVLPAVPVPIEVRAVGTAPIERVEVVSRHGVVGSRVGEGVLVHGTFPLDPAPGDFAYVRVVQTDGGLAWSSPFFFD